MKTNRENKLKISVHDIALIGMMTAILEVSKVILSFLPNVELVTFWIIMFTLFFGPKVIYSIIAFILIEISVYGIHTWVIMYFYTWPTLALIVCLCRKNRSIWLYSILSGIYGLLFGFFCAIPYLFIGAVDGGIRSGLIMAFNWWVAGIPFDLVHGVANFMLMFVLYTPVRALLDRAHAREFV
ncbi:MAG TPA: hypothetical protein VJY54_11710 [Lachnospiraceae bacterium]|nr:hypothetical protein [Lachnospiraceae bacterium]